MEWGIDLKSANKFLYIKWFVLTVLITMVCVMSGIFILHTLTEHERNNMMKLRKEQSRGRLFGHTKDRIEIIKSLSDSGKMTVDEAYHLVDRSDQAPFPEASYLLDQNQKIIDSKRSESFKDDVDKFQDFKLSENRTLRVFIDDERHHRRGGPGGRRGPPGGGPPPGAILIGLTAIGVSIIVGIGLSLIILTVYLRRRARQVEDVMERIKSGDLKARFTTNETDESGVLMLHFNEMADEIENLVMNLKNTEESRTRLLQELAHDLRTPVASMKNLQETLFTKGHLLEVGKREQLQNLAMKEVSYFERLVEDLLFLSGVNDPRYGQSFKKIDLSELVQEEMGVFNQGKLKLDFDSSKGAMIKGDEHLLRRLLKNALSNASRHAKTAIKVEVFEDSGSVTLRVSDDGKGLKSEDIKSFGEKKFSRQVDEEESVYISIGLGSVIMKKIMGLHNGDLKIKNGNVGAVLDLVFPNL